MKKAPGGNPDKAVFFENLRQKRKREEEEGIEVDEAGPADDEDMDDVLDSIEDMDVDKDD